MADHNHAAVDEPLLGTSAPSTVPQAPTKTKPGKPKRRQLPPFKLILHNDDVNIMDIVALDIVKITPLDGAAAVRKTLEAHHTGTAVLLITHKERGELYVQQFASVKITTTLEADA